MSSVQTPLPSASASIDAGRGAAEVIGDYVDSRCSALDESRTTEPLDHVLDRISYPVAAIDRPRPTPHPCREAPGTPEPVGRRERASARVPRQEHR